MWSRLTDGKLVIKAPLNPWGTKDGLGGRAIGAIATRSVLYRVLFHYFERFLTICDGRLDTGYGYFRLVPS